LNRAVSSYRQRTLLLQEEYSAVTSATSVAEGREGVSILRSLTPRFSSPNSLRWSFNAGFVTNARSSEIALALTSALIAALTFSINRLFEELKDSELRQLVAYTRTIETDPERLERLKDLVGERGYICHIVWLVDRSPDELSEEFREVELELYRLARRSGEVLVTILDFNKHRTVVVDLMRKLGITDLPALVVSEKRIDLKNPDKEGTAVIRSGALKRLAEQGRIRELISNIPVWASLGVLRDRVKLEAGFKSLFGKLWDEVKQLISINI